MKSTDDVVKVIEKQHSISQDIYIDEEKVRKVGAGYEWNFFVYISSSIEKDFNDLEEEELFPEHWVTDFTNKKNIRETLGKNINDKYDAIDKLMERERAPSYEKNFFQEDKWWPRAKYLTESNPRGCLVILVAFIPFAFLLQLT